MTSLAKEYLLFLYIYIILLSIKPKNIGWDILVTKSSRYMYAFLNLYWVHSEQNLICWVIALFIFSNILTLRGVNCRNNSQNSNHARILRLWTFANEQLFVETEREDFCRYNLKLFERFYRWCHHSKFEFPLPWCINISLGININ